MMRKYKVFARKTLYYQREDSMEGFPLSEAGPSVVLLEDQGGSKTSSQAAATAFTKLDCH